MQAIRSFIAVPLAPGVRAATTRLIRRLQEPGDGIRWVPTENLHLTLKFLGDVDNVQVPEICRELEAVALQVPPFDLGFGGTGGFPQLERARTLWVGIDDPSQRLRQLVADIERRMADLGFKPESRDYRPHLTLGRTRSGARRVTEHLVERLAAERKTRLGEMTADTVVLVASFLDKRGPTYQTMATFSLEG